MESSNNRCAAAGAETSATPDSTSGSNVAFYIDPEASSHDLLNAATEWLQYARGTTALIAELMSDIELQNLVHYPRLIIALEGISAMTSMGVQFSAEAHSRMCWEQARERAAQASDPGAGT